MMFIFREVAGNRETILRLFTSDFKDSIFLGGKKSIDTLDEWKLTACCLLTPIQRLQKLANKQIIPTVCKQRVPNAVQLYSL